MFKDAPNIDDIGKIKKMVAAGEDVPTIARKIKVDEKAVQNYVDAIKKKNAPAKKPAAKKAEDAGKDNPLD